VVEHGTLPLDDLYFALKPLSSNLGAVDYPVLVAGRQQAVRTNEDGAFQLFRIGDAVALPKQSMPPSMTASGWRWHSETGARDCRYGCSS